MITQTTISSLILNTEAPLTHTTTPLSTISIQSQYEPNTVQSLDSHSFANNNSNSNFNYIQSFIESEKFVKPNESSTTTTTTTTTTTPIVETTTIGNDSPIETTTTFIIPDANIIDALPVTTIELFDGKYFGPKSLPNGCTSKFICRKRERLYNQRFCIKYILKYFLCNGEEVSVSRKNWQRDIDIDKIAKELEEDKNKTEDELNKKYGLSPVHMVDFPCQPNYLPDRRGICREVW